MMVIPIFVDGRPTRWNGRMVAGAVVSALGMIGIIAMTILLVIAVNTTSAGLPSSGGPVEPGGAGRMTAMAVAGILVTSVLLIVGLATLRRGALASVAQMEQGAEVPEGTQMLGARR